MSDYEFVSTNTSDIVALLIKRYESISGVTVKPASPERLFIDWVAAIIVQERVNINYAANQNIPSRASGENLDALAEFFAVPERPPAKKAVCSILFTLTEARSFNVVIPVNTQVSDVSGSVVFATDKSITIAAGETSGSVSATCTTAGKFSNGYTAGQIYVPVGVMEDFIASCVNTDTTAGGADEATDDEFFRLMKLSLATFSTAGAEAAYEYFARSVSEDIGSVVVSRGALGTVCTLPIVSVGTSKYMFLGGDTIQIESIVVKSEDESTTYALDTDYTIETNKYGVMGLIGIAIKSTSALASASYARITFMQDAAGYVFIYALTDEGEPVSAELKAKILEACSARNVRPLTDYVHVADPGTQSFSVDITYYSWANSDVSTQELSEAVTKAVNDYIAWQTEKIGRDINPSKLIQLVMAAGAKRVTVTSPTYTHVADGSNGEVPNVASLSGTATITYGGAEDD